MKAIWLEQRERGSFAALHLISWITGMLGRRIGRILLVPICWYFVAFFPRARRASRAFLTRILGTPASLPRIFRHFHVFASTLLDRVEMLSHGSARFDIRIHNGAALDAIVSRGRGCLLLGSHLGSFEILRAYGERHQALAINLVMHEGNSRMMSRWLRGMAPELSGRVIAPGTPETLFRVRDCLDRGEIVAMLGDRRFGSERTARCRFLGDHANFPSGPMLAAALLRTPVVAFFCLHRSDLRYDVHFEVLAERVELGDGARNATIVPWVERYVRQLEAYARLAPYNWFNYYDFWQGA
ncbi:MAG TPA: acyl-CoA synthetase [Burkholderiales bacterium]|nr:acyl-CoA synthetase [Burkholderiales bacterium]